MQAIVSSNHNINIRSINGQKSFNHTMVNFPPHNEFTTFFHIDRSDINAREYGILSCFCVIEVPNHGQTNHRQTKKSRTGSWTYFRIRSDASPTLYTIFNSQAHLNAQRNETEAKLTKAYGLAQTYLTVYDQRELIKETLDERINLPEPTNRIWVDQIIPIIYSRIRKNKSRRHKTIFLRPTSHEHERRIKLRT